MSKTRKDKEKYKRKMERENCDPRRTIPGRRKPRTQREAERYYDGVRDWGIEGSG